MRLPSSSRHARRAFTEQSWRSPESRVGKKKRGLEKGLFSHAALDAIDLPEPSAAASTVSSGVSILIQEMVMCGMITCPFTAATIAAKRDDICRYGTRTGRSRSQDPEKSRPDRSSCDPTTRGVMTITCFPSRLSRVRVPSPAPRNLTYLYHFYPHRHCSRFVKTSGFDGRFHELLISRHKAKAARETRTTGSIRRTLAISARYRKALIGKITRPGTPTAPGVQ